MDSFHITPKRNPIRVPSLFFDGQVYPCECKSAGWDRINDVLTFTCEVRLFINEFRAQVVYVHYPELSYSLEREGSDLVLFKKACIYAHGWYIDYWRNKRREQQRRFLVRIMRSGVE